MRMTGNLAGLLALLCCSGCLAVLAGGGAVGVRELTDKAVIYAGDIRAVENAVNKAMADLGATTKETVRETKKGGDVTIRGRTYDGEHLTIDMEPTSPSSVLVEIRVGRIGSKKRAKEFHQAIQKYLKPR